MYISNSNVIYTERADWGERLRVLEQPPLERGIVGTYFSQWEKM